MTTTEFQEWLEQHCQYFSGVRKFCGHDEAKKWSRVLAPVLLSDALAASLRMYEDIDHRPHQYSDHAAQIKKLAGVIAKERKGEPIKGAPRLTAGDIQYEARQMAKPHWMGLTESQRQQWVAFARKQLGPVAALNPDRRYGDPATLVRDYAETLHAEAKFPDMKAKAERAGEYRPGVQ